MLRRVIPTTIRGQITVIIIAALLIVIVAGRALERWSKSDLRAPDIESISESLAMIAGQLRYASPAERELILAYSRRAGWNVALEPISISQRFTGSSNLENPLGRLVDWLFPPDDVRPPVGGWRTFLNGERVVAWEVDDRTLVVLSGFPNAILTSSSLSQGSYYIVAVIVLIAFFFVFAIRAITEPIQRIAEAANDSDIANSSHIFEERGSIEIIALSRALNGMRSRIRVMVESRTRMLRGIGHDLRTPLTRLRLRAERMEEGAERDGLLSDIVRIDTLLAESLHYLRDEYAVEPFERTDLASILQTVCDEFTDVGFDVRYSGPDRIIATCKPLAIMRAITNLCDNGVKFGTSVEVRLTRSEAGYDIIVSDDGPGIDPLLQTRVFEPFFKIDDARQKENVGFGLGLSIVADIVHSHRGTIELSQNRPKGLKIAIFLPVSRLSAER